MRIKIRKGVFETNSSSMHSLVVKKENEYYTQEEMTGRMYLDDNGVWKIWSDDDLHFTAELQGLRIEKEYMFEVVADGNIRIENLKFRLKSSGIIDNDIL